MKKPNEWIERVKFNELMNQMNYELYEFPKRVLFRFQWIVVAGFLLTVLPVMNILGVTNISGDFFWALAGACLMVEAMMELYYERRKRL